MRRTLLVFLLAALTGTFALSGCSNKKPASTAASTDSSASTTDSASGAKETDVSSTGGAGNGKGGDASSLSTVYFGFNEATVRTEDRDKLKAAAEYLKSSKLKVTIEGHCDERGSTEYNLALGERRAQSVKGYLTKLGVPAANLTTISYGE